MLKRFGVKHRIDEPTDACLILSFLAAFFAKAGRPLCIYIDQIERLVLDGPPEKCEANRGYLHTCIERLLRNGGFLCLTGVTKAWDSFKGDVIQRLSVPLLPVPNLSFNQTLNLIKVYLGPGQEFEEYSNQNDIYPFLEKAVKQIHSISGGNLRFTLRLCYECLDTATPKKRVITVDLVKDTAEAVASSYNRETVLAEIKGRLKVHGVSFEEQATLTGDITVDITIPDASNPSAIIDVSEPAYIDEEVVEAIHFTGLSEQIRKAYPAAKLVLIKAGYASPSIQSKLDKITDINIDYNPQEFTTLFDSVIPDLIRHRPESQQPKVVEKEDLAQLVDEFKKIQTAIVKNQAQLSNRMEGFLKTTSNTKVNNNEVVQSKPLLSVLLKPQNIFSLFALTLAFSVILFFMMFYQRSEYDRRIADAQEKVSSYVSTQNNIGLKDALELLVSKRVSLDGIKLPNSVIRNVDLSGAELNGADLSKADLTRATLASANLANANLTGGVLVEVDLLRANLRGAHLEGTNLVGANLREASLEDTNLIGANLRGVLFEGTRLVNCDISGAIFDQSFINYIKDLNIENLRLCANPDNPPMGLPKEILLPPCEQKKP